MDTAGATLHARLPTPSFVLDGEHDAFAWLTLDEACARCLPPQVAAGLREIATR